ncbi:predicted protein [Botrytis cinerea T4]|uniref:Uncharacterized protein n=1 Tax=Botryotinia fuckeliana (strain T4) TaxID=999810 RepID=G2Y8L5_BOTF4|nr:predicted protein [Botrytis cinerea T4]
MFRELENDKPKSKAKTANFANSVVGGSNAELASY